MFIAGGGTGIFVYRELAMSRNIPLNDSTNKTTKTNEEKDKMKEV